MKCPEEANPERQKIGEVVPGAGGREEWEMTANRHEVSLGVIKLLWNYRVVNI